MDHRVLGRRIMGELGIFPLSTAMRQGEHGSKNIQSPHKELITYVSIADILTSVLHEIGFSAETEEHLTPYLKYSGNTPGSVEILSGELYDRAQEQSPLPGVQEASSGSDQSTPAESNTSAGNLILICKQRGNRDSGAQLC